MNDWKLYHGKLASYVSHSNTTWEEYTREPGTYIQEVWGCVPERGDKQTKILLILFLIKQSRPSVVLQLTLTSDTSKDGQNKSHFSPQVTLCCCIIINSQGHSHRMRNISSYKTKQKNVIKTMLKTNLLLGKMYKNNYLPSPPSLLSCKVSTGYSCRLNLLSWEPAPFLCCVFFSSYVTEAGRRSC